MDLSINHAKKLKLEDQQKHEKLTGYHPDPGISVLHPAAIAAAAAAAASSIDFSFQAARLQPQLITRWPWITTTADILLELEKLMCLQLSTLQFTAPVSCIYNPLEYAYEPHGQYVRRYCSGDKDVLLIGMNPGPFGMVQTGVPFGEVSLVRDWLQINGTVGKPSVEHPQRKVMGFNCTRSEVSGKRFWSFFKDLCVTPGQFFRTCYVHNYCPLVFMNESGKNITPNKLPLNERKALQQICDRHISDVIKLLKVKMVIGVGRFPYERIKAVVKQDGIPNVRVEFIMHPSPINPIANKEWADIVMKQLHEMNIMHCFSA